MPFRNGTLVHPGGMSRDSGTHKRKTGQSRSKRDIWSRYLSLIAQQFNREYAVLRIDYIKSSYELNTYVIRNSLLLNILVNYSLILIRLKIYIYIFLWYR